ncbi:hypothetical protein TL5118_02289 [Thalassovita autumnalis]|uniref:Uncharacterized protein n=1 Tax=Thalassovita autumnalis TaxID=2072972 RepID=A0A0P1FID7_9RHOB|nr:hypothetical protein TL5118_02289 [Thalassovita autumnalis]CUH73986.1 hypothetical protein TL5120_03804 [Thalassovita autumnalis]
MNISVSNALFGWTCYGNVALFRRQKLALI